MLTSYNKDRVIKAYKEQGWKEITEDIKDGEIFLLLVCNTEHPLQDDVYSVTIGFNNFNENGYDNWEIVGWSWTHDHFTTDREAIPLLYKEFENNIIPIIETIE